jgi:putative membrane protein
VTFATLYPWLKALHVAVAIVFAGGVLSVSVFLAAVAGAADASEIARRVRSYDLAVMTPAMLLVWTFGLALAIGGQWFSELWLQAKLVFVVALSALHGVQSGRLRRLAGGAPVANLRLVPFVVVAIAVVAVLAVAKP